MIELYLTNIKKMENSYIDLLGKLTPKRREKTERYLFLQDRLRCMAGGLLLKEVLGIQRDEELIINVYDKPSLRQGGKHFNLSHSGDYVVLAVDVCEVGVDIERIECADMAVAERCFQKDELDYVTNSKEDRNQRFFSLWTLKESLMKATGLGLSLPPESFSVLPFDKPIIFNDGVIWHFKQYHPDENHIISVCASHQNFTTTFQEIVFL